MTNIIPNQTPAPLAQAVHGHAFQQLKMLDKASPKSRWMSIGKGRFENISLLRYLFEKVKACFGWSTRVGKAELKANFLSLIHLGIKYREFKKDDLALIQNVALRMGIIPGKRDPLARQLSDFIQKIAHPIFEQKPAALSPQPFQGKLIQPPVRDPVVPPKRNDQQSTKVVSSVVKNPDKNPVVIDLPQNVSIPKPLDPEPAKKEESTQNQEGEDLNKEPSKEEVREEPTKNEAEEAQSPKDAVVIDVPQNLNLPKETSVLNAPPLLEPQKATSLEDNNPEVSTREELFRQYSQEADQAIKKHHEEAELISKYRQELDQAAEDLQDREELLRHYRDQVDQAVENFFNSNKLNENPQATSDSSTGENKISSQENASAPLEIENKIVESENALVNSWLELDKEENPLDSSALNPFSEIEKSLDDPLYKHNLGFIITWLEGTAITSSEGKLHTEGYFKGTEFPETLTVIKKTLDHSLEAFSKTYEMTLNEQAEKKTEKLRLLADQLIHIMNLSDGMKRILKKYEYMENLNLLVKGFAENEQRCIEKFNALKSLITPLRLGDVNVENAAKNLGAFCSLFCKNIDPHTAWDWIQKGQTLVKNILQSDYKPPKDQKESEKELTALSWFLMYAAIKKKQGFEEGAFVIMDAEQRLYRYLQNSPGFGERASSHLVGRSPNNKSLTSLIMKSALHGGLDVLTEEMPAEKRTLDITLFKAYQEDQHYLFIKPESFSPFLTTAYGYDFLWHGIELVEAQARKRWKKGGDDLPGMQKERVPDNSKDTFTKLVELIKPELVPSKFKLELCKKEANLWGIAYMYDFVRHLKNSKVKLEADVVKSIAAFEETIKDLDHPEKRTGKEVFISDSELQKLIEHPLIEI